MREHRRAHGGRTALCAVLVMATGISAASAAGDPQIAYWTEDDVVVADASGAITGTFPNFDRFSFAGSLLAGQRDGKRHSSERVIGLDLGSGERVFSIRNATNPVVAPTGEVVAFLPTYRREE